MSHLSLSMCLCSNTPDRKSTRLNGRVSRPPSKTPCVERKYQENSPDPEGWIDYLAPLGSRSTRASRSMESLTSSFLRHRMDLDLHAHRIPHSGSQEVIWGWITKGALAHCRLYLQTSGARPVSLDPMDLGLPNTRASPLSTKRCVDKRECAVRDVLLSPTAVCFVVDPIFLYSSQRESPPPVAFPVISVVVRRVYVSPETGNTE